jgi:gluconolactonase
MTTAWRLPGPTELLPGLPDAVIDLSTEEGLHLVGGEWRYADARVEEIDFPTVGQDLGPSGPPGRTYDVVPHAEGADFDDSSWAVLKPAELELRLAGGRVCFNWYRTRVIIPERVGDFETTGATAVFEVVVDDYAEVWVNGRLPLALGKTGGPVVAGFNAANRVVLSEAVKPGETFQIAVFGINGPISASPRNYIWIRSATIDLYGPARSYPARRVAAAIDRAAPALDRLVAPGTPIEQVAGGFEFTEGPVWTRDGALLFSSPNTNAIYRWEPTGSVSLYRAKSGYAGADVGRFRQPGSNGLTFDPQGRLTMCQHGNRRVLRVEPRGNTTVLADRYDGRRLNSPNDLVYRSDGSLYFTDPPFGLPGMSDDPERELPYAGVFRVAEGRVILLTDELAGPNGIAFSPDEQVLYVGNWDPGHKVVMRYEVDRTGDLRRGEVLHDMTAAKGEDAIDGIKVDSEGNLYVCGPSGIWVLSPAGSHLGLIMLPESPHNLAWGDADASTLYITAMSGIYRIRVGVPGRHP